MWRKFSAAQASSASSASKKVPHSTGTTSSAGGFGFGEPTDVAAVPARRRLPDDSVHDMIGIEKRRRRRRKSRPKRNGWVQWYFCSYCPSAVDIATCSYGSSIFRHSSERNKPQDPLPVTPEATLKQKAVAKLKLFNFTLNWDLQMTQCKPCGWVTEWGRRGKKEKRKD